MNHALALMAEEEAQGAPRIDVLAVLDCDHVPLPTFLTATLGWFDDPELALVQGPQSYYNSGAFDDDGVTGEQGMFFHVLLPARNHDGAGPFWCGSTSLIRASRPAGDRRHRHRDHRRGHAHHPRPDPARLEDRLPPPDRSPWGSRRRPPSSTSSSGAAGAWGRCRCWRTRSCGRPSGGCRGATSTSTSPAPCGGSRASPRCSCSSSRSWSCSAVPRPPPRPARVRGGLRRRCSCCGCGAPSGCSAGTCTGRPRSRCGSSGSRSASPACGGCSPAGRSTFEVTPKAGADERLRGRVPRVLLVLIVVVTGCPAVRRGRRARPGALAHQHGRRPSPRAPGSPLADVVLILGTRRITDTDYSTSRRNAHRTAVTASVTHGRRRGRAGRHLGRRRRRTVPGGNGSHRRPGRAAAPGGGSGGDVGRPCVAGHQRPRRGVLPTAGRRLGGLPRDVALAVPHSDREWSGACPPAYPRSPPASGASRRLPFDRSASPLRSHPRPHERPAT